MPRALFGDSSEPLLAPIAVLDLLGRLGAAVLVGFMLSARPWRFLMRRALPRAEMVQAQILLCAAAAVVTAVIGNSLAKAFGLVGLGGFVRFRSGLKDPRDAAILFLVIGLGMACGHGDLELAMVGTGFVAVLLLAADLFTRGDGFPQRLKLTAEADDVATAEAVLRKAFGERNVLVRGAMLDTAGKRLELELEETEPGGAAAAIAHAHLPTLREVRWAPIATKPKEDLA